MECNTKAYPELSGLIQRVGLAAIDNAIAEGGQERLQQLIEKTNAKGACKPHHDLSEDVAYNALLGIIADRAVGGVPKKAAAPPENAKAYLNPEEASRFIGVSKQTLAKWRCKGGKNTIPFVRAGGRKVMYAREDLVEWMRERRVFSTSEAT